MVYRLYFYFCAYPTKDLYPLFTFPRLRCGTQIRTVKCLRLHVLTLVSPWLKFSYYIMASYDLQPHVKFSV